MLVRRAQRSQRTRENALGDRLRTFHLAAIVHAKIAASVYPFLMGRRFGNALAFDMLFPVP